MFYLVQIAVSDPFKYLYGKYTAYAPASEARVRLGWCIVAKPASTGIPLIGLIGSVDTKVLKFNLCTHIVV